MKQALLVFAFIGAFLGSGFSSVYADSQNTIEENILNGHTLVPIEMVFPMLHANYLWDEETGIIQVSNGSQIVGLKIGSEEMVLNGKVVSVNTPAILSEGQPFVPLRAVGEALEYVVEWDSTQQEAVIETKDKKFSITISIPTAEVSNWSEMRK